MCMTTYEKNKKYLNIGEMENGHKKKTKKELDTNRALFFIDF